jgi:hypothetical protein
MNCHHHNSRRLFNHRLWHPIVEVLSMNDNFLE